jgi:uncharacterized protein YbaR (Trm112 family)
MVASASLAGPRVATILARRASRRVAPSHGSCSSVMRCGRPGGSRRVSSHTCYAHASGVLRPVFAATTAPMIDPKLLEILVCPATRAPLTPSPDGTELWCRASHLAYPVRDGIPVLLEEEARRLTEEEYESLR